MKSLFWIPLSTALVGMVIMAILSFSAAPSAQGILFATLVSADRDSSISEKEGATNFFAETIIGWTHSPAFRNEVLQGKNGNFSGQKQERQNMVFTISTSNAEEANQLSQSLTQSLNAQLADVNRVSETMYRIIFSPLQVTENSPKSLWRIVAGAIFGGIIGIFAIPLAQRAKRKRFFEV
ncbi:MAG: hypothetical protein WCJ84_01915 [Candidatus Peregrinibacteria bacterium]